MSIPVSTAPAVVQALFTQVAAQLEGGPTGDVPLLIYGEPGMDLPDEIIQICMGIRRGVKPVTFIGDLETYSLGETYVIQNVVSVVNGGPDPLAVLTRVYELAGYIETAVRTDPTFGGLVNIAYPSGTDGGKPDWTPNPTTKRYCELNVDVTVDVLN